MNRSHHRFGWLRAVVFLLFAAFPWSTLAQSQAPVQEPISPEPIVPSKFPGCENGIRISSVQLKGCTTERCSRSDIREKLRSLTDLWSGWKITEERLDIAHKRLLSTKVAAEIKFICTPADKGAVDLTIELIPQRFVESVKIRGNKTFYRSEIKRRLLVESGNALTPGTAAADKFIQNQKDLLQRMYREGGFDETEVAVDIAPSGREGTNVVIRIREGRRKRIARLSVKSRPKITAKPGLPTCRKPDSEEIKKVSGFSVGGGFTSRNEREAKRKIESYLWSRGYEKPDVRISYTEQSSGARKMLYGNGVTEINIRFSTCTLIDVQARDQAGDPFHVPETTTYLDALSFKESGTFDWAEAQYSRRKLIQYLQSKGHFFASVDVDYQLTRETAPEIKDSNIRGYVRFRITKGPLTEIRGVTIKGIPAAHRSEALRLMQTKPYDFFGVGGYLQIPRLVADLERVANHFNSIGYFDFRFRNTTGRKELEVVRRRSPEAEIMEVRYANVAARILRPLGESYIYISAKAELGNQTRVEKLQFWGVEHLSEKEANDAIGLKRDGPFSRQILARGIKKLRAKYQSRGYHNTTIRADCSSSDRPDLGKVSCFLWNVSVRDLTIHLQVNEGRTFTVGEVFWTGNFRTRPSIIARDLPKTGDPFDAERIRSGLRKIRRLGIFSSVRPNFIGLDEKPPRDRIGVVLELHESPARSIDMAAGLETISRIQDSASPRLTAIMQNSLSVSDVTSYGQSPTYDFMLPDFLMTFETAYIDSNFLGRAMELQIPLKYGLSTTDLFRYGSFTPTWINRRLFGTELRARFTPFVIYDKAFQSLDIFEFGVETELSQRFAEKVLFALQIEASRIQSRIPGQDFDPFSTQTKIRPQLALDFLNSPINPIYGQYLSASVAAINEIEEGESRNYVKYDLRLKLFRNIRKTLTIGLLLRFGKGNSLDGGRLPENERFVLGGNKGVRGFQDDGIFQYDENGCIRLEYKDAGGNTQPVPLDANCQPLQPIGEGTGAQPVFGGGMLALGTVEVRFPILRRSGVWGTLFYDVGAIADNFETLTASSFRQSAGLGLRYLIGNSIPVRLDYGFKLDRRCAEIDTEDGQCLQEEPVGNLHFGILYTF